MNEFIKELIERLEEREVQAYAKTDGGATYQTYRNVIEMVIQLAEEQKQQLSNDLEIVSSLPSLYPLQPFEEEAIHRVVASVNNNGWIPCSERLPSEDEMERSYCRNMYGSEFVVMIDGATLPTTLYRTLDGFWVDDNRDVYEVVAWCELPAPYQPEGE